jgi:hypothetical protein
MLPGEACLHCRGTIPLKELLAESLTEEERAYQVAEGYIAGTPERAPAVVMFTTAVAAQAVIELLHRLTGFMGDDRNVSEVVFLFLDTKYIRNRREPKSDCVFCGSSSSWARGDSHDFLGFPGWRME